MKGRNTTILIISITLFLTFAISCSEEIVPTPYTYTQVFSGKNSKTWIFKSIILWEEGKADINFTLSNCVKDDRYVFYANSEKTYEVLPSSGHNCFITDIKRRGTGDGSD